MDLLDRWLPEFDVSDQVAVTVAADPTTTWEALMDADLIEVGRRRRAVGVLGAARALPGLIAGILHGDAPPRPPERVTLRDTTAGDVLDGAWIPLGEEPYRWIALGLVGRFWKPVIEYAAVRPEVFAAFAEPGYAKTIYVLELVTLDDGRTRLSGSMRTATTDEHARRWFRRYWTFGVGSGAHVLVTALIELVRDDAEARVSPAAPAPAGAAAR